jgi:hypothetical protein
LRPAHWHHVRMILAGRLSRAEEGSIPTNWKRCRSKPYRGWVCKWLWYTDIVTDGLQAPQETAIGCRVVLNKRGTLQALRRCEAIAPVRQRKLRRRTASEQRSVFNNLVFIISFFKMEWLPN